MSWRVRTDLYAASLRLVPVAISLQYHLVISGDVIVVDSKAIACRHLTVPEAFEDCFPAQFAIVVGRDFQVNVRNC